MMRPGPAVQTAAPPATLWHLLCFALVGLVLLWLPMAVLQQVDALLRFTTPVELAADVALLLLLLAVCSAALALLGAGCGHLLRRLRASQNVAQVAAWLLVLVPVGLACVWQAALTVKLWLEQVLDMRLSTGTLPYRNLLVLALLAVMVYGARRAGVSRVIRALTTPVLRASAAAWLAVALALACVAWQRPAIGARPQPIEPAPRSAPGAPDIIFITLDTLAFEDAAVCGSGPTRMPKLRQLAGRSTCFTRHYASSTLTHPSTITLETSTLPWTHWVVHGGRPPADLAQESIGHHLRQAGYRTHAITAAPGASPRQHGTYPGYDSAEMARTESINMSTVNAILEFPDSRALPGLLGGVLSLTSMLDLTRLDRDNPYPAEYVYEPATRLLDAPSRRPLFMWLHTWPPHAPYLPPPSTRYKLLPPGQFDRYRDFLSEVGSYDPTRQSTVDKNRLRYQETILGADESLGHFLDELERRGRLEQALVVITSDHGESFERGILRHGGPALHEAVIRVPLVIKLPGQTIGRIVDTPTSQLDIAPTLLALAGAKPIPRAEGRSLVPALGGETMPTEPVLAMALLRESRFQPLRSGTFVVIDGSTKLVHQLANNRSELYDLAEDPKELRDLSAARPEVTERMLTLLRARIAQADKQRAQRFGMP